MVAKCSLHLADHANFKASKPTVRATKNILRSKLGQGNSTSASYDKWLFLLSIFVDLIFFIIILVTEVFLPSLVKNIEPESGDNEPQLRINFV